MMFFFKAYLDNLSELRRPTFQQKVEEVPQLLADSAAMVTQGVLHAQQFRGERKDGNLLCEYEFDDYSSFPEEGLSHPEQKEPLPPYSGAVFQTKIYLGNILVDYPSPIAVAMTVSSYLLRTALYIPIMGPNYTEKDAEGEPLLQYSVIPTPEGICMGLNCLEGQKRELAETIAKEAINRNIPQIENFVKVMFAMRRGNSEE